MLGPRARTALLPASIGLLLLLIWSTALGADQPAALDPRPLALTVDDLPAGFVPDPAQVVDADLPAGGLLHIAVFRRAADGGGPVLVRHTVQSLASEDAARSLYVGLPATLAEQGFGAVASDVAGPESALYTSSDQLDGQPVVYQTIAFRLGTCVVLTTLIGPPATTQPDQIVELARRAYVRVADALGLAAPAFAPLALAEPPAVQSGAGPATTPDGGPGILLSGVLTEAPELGAGLRLGGFSSLVALDGSGTLFLTITDRGPNEAIGSGKNEKMTFPRPDYSPSILKIQLQDGQVRILERTPLKLSAGSLDPLTGTSNVSGVSNTSRDETPWGMNGQSRLPYDPNGIDSESLTLDRRDGSYWIGEEYGPSILHVASDGTILTRLVPRGLSLDAPGENVQAILPKELLKRKANRGFEGIGLSPDGGTLFAIMQSPLSNPDENAGEESRNIRLLTLDVSAPLSPRLSGMYLYEAEPASEVGGEQDDVKVGDLAALSASRALVLERDSVEGGDHKMVYSIDLSGATNLLEAGSTRGKTLEEMDDGDLKRARISPVGKQPVANLASYGYRPEYLEGLAVVDDRTIAAVNDNNFGFEGFDASGQAIPSGAETRLVLVRLDRALR